jgi:NAD(P)-dependent dehydrogenase (short-subunit alcohol dehydrogenase family)
MELAPGKVAVVTGAASGIGLALADRFAQAGMHVVLADIETGALERAAEQIAGHGVDTLAVRTDVSQESEVQALAAATIERFGSVHVVCNNAGVVAKTDPWLGPLSAWEWVMGVNFWGVVHGIRAFLPLLAAGGGHIVNTASIAGLMPGFGPSYDASKHAVVAISEDLFLDLSQAGVPVGVSVLCPGWVRTDLMSADRNWPTEQQGAIPDESDMNALLGHHFVRALAEGTPPAAIADQVADAVAADRFWVLPHDDFLELAIRRWHLVSEKLDPQAHNEIPGLPSRDAMLAEALEAMATPGEAEA